MAKVKMQMVTRLTITDPESGECLRDYRTSNIFEGGYSDIESAKACLLQGVEQAKSTIAGLEVRQNDNE